MPRWPSVLVVGSVAGFASVTGCGLLYAPSADEFSRPIEDGGRPVEDASSDGVLVDVVTVEGGNNLGFACPPGAILCDDFERPSVLGVFANASGPVAISTEQAHLSKRSLSATLQASKASPSVESALTIPLTAPPRVTFSFWFYTPTKPPAYNIRIGSMLFGPGCDWDLAWTIYINEDGLKAAADVYDPAVNPGCGPADGKTRTLLTAAELYVAKWHHVVMRADMRFKSRRVEVQIDEGPILVDETPSHRSSEVRDFKPAIGLPCVTTSGGCFDWDQSNYEAFFDDVAVFPTP